MQQQNCFRTIARTVHWYQYLYSWVERVKCLAQEHNTITQLARAQTQTAHSRVQHANHLATFAKFSCCFYFIFQTFQDEGLSNYIVVYLRLLTSAQLQKKSEFFENFIEGGRTVQEFRSQVIIYLQVYTAAVFVSYIFNSLSSIISSVYLSTSLPTSISCAVHTYKLLPVDCVIKFVAVCCLNWMEGNKGLCNNYQEGGLENQRGGHKVKSKQG